MTTGTARERDPYCMRNNSTSGPPHAGALAGCHTSAPTGNSAERAAAHRRHRCRACLESPTARHGLASQARPSRLHWRTTSHPPVSPGPTGRSRRLDRLPRELAAGEQALQLVADVLLVAHQPVERPDEPRVELVTLALARAARGLGLGDQCVQRRLRAAPLRAEARAQVERLLEQPLGAVRQLVDAGVQRVLLRVEYGLELARLALERADLVLLVLRGEKADGGR